MPITIDTLYRYPVKTLQGEALSAATITQNGVEGDRCWAICRRSDGEPLAAKNYPWLMTFTGEYLDQPQAGQRTEVRIYGPDFAPVLSTDADCDQRLSERVGESVFLRHSSVGEFFFDTAIHLLSTNTLASLRRHQAQFADRGASDYDPRRFRPNVLIRVEDGEAAFPEHGWLNRSLSSPALQLAMVRPTDRCGMTTYPFAELPSDPTSLRGVVEAAQGVAGVYANVVAGGVSHAGDVLTVSASAP